MNHNQYKVEALRVGRLWCEVGAHPIIVFHCFKL